MIAELATDIHAMDSRARLLTHARKVFQREYQRGASRLAIAPARVELLGNHTDYNGGLVMSAAIDRYTVVAGGAGDGPFARIYSEQFDERLIVDANDDPRGFEGWRRYVSGVIDALRSKDTSAFDAAIVGNIPVGSGLSSSASLEAALALLLRGFESGSPEVSDVGRFALAQRLQRVENEVVGVACGLLDQFSVMLGSRGHALWLDCANNDFGRVPLGTNPPAIAVCDTKTSRRLADGMYNARRAECERVVAYFRTLGENGVRWLRDVSLADLESHWDRLDPIGRRRARHVLSENERVRAGIVALGRGDIAAFGQLMSASHISSRDDFENSSAELDAMIEAAESAPGFLGGKLSGAGWAGCTVNLVAAERAESFAEAVGSAYARTRKVTPEIHICHASAGALLDVTG